MLKLDCSHTGYVFVEAASCLFTPEFTDYSQVSQTPFILTPTQADGLCEDYFVLICNILACF